MTSITLLNTLIVSQKQTINMKILITGNRGFVGSETQKELEKLEHEVLGFDLMDGKDIRDFHQLNEFAREHKPDRILHLAAIARFADADADPKLANETNVLGTKHVAQVAAVHHIPVVYSSTGSVYMPIKETPPITEQFRAIGNSQYGCSKYLGETYIREVTPHIILRYAHLYGKEKRMHGLIGGFLDRIAHGMAPTLYGGKQSNDFTYIKDIATANILALTSPWDKWNQVYNIGTGEELTAEAAGKLICDATGYKGEIEIKEQRGVDPDRFAFSVKKAEIMLGFKAKWNFKDGLADMFADMSDVKLEANPLKLNYGKN